MNTMDITAARSEFSRLWPQSRMNPDEWSVVIEKMHGIPIDSAQASAAMRNLKATVDGCPSVATLLQALRGAVSAVAVAAAPQGNQSPGWGSLAAEELDENGLTSFERRVLDDEKFREYAKQHGMLKGNRLNDIRAKVGLAQEAA